MPQQESGYAHSLARTAVAQIIYGQAQRLAEAHKTSLATKGSGKSNAKANKPAAPGAQHLAPETMHMTKGVSEALADVAMSFIEQLAKESNEQAELAGRSDCNLLDVLNSLDIAYKFTHTSLRDLAKYHMFQEIPFPYDVPKFPASPRPRKRARELHIEEEDKRERNYIDSWMPTLPSAHTFISTPMAFDKAEKKKDPAVLREQRLSIEKSLAKLKEAQTNGSDKENLLSQAAASAPNNPYLVRPRLGEGDTIDDHGGVDRAELTEPPMDDVEDARDTNGNLVDKPKGAIHDQRRARVNRIITSDALASSSAAADTTGVSDSRPS